MVKKEKIACFLKHILLKKINYIVLLSIIYYLLLPQPSLADYEINQENVFKLSLLPMFIFDKYQKNTLNIISKASYHLQIKQWGLVAPQKEEKSILAVVAEPKKIISKQVILADKIVKPENENTAAANQNYKESRKVTITAYSSTPDQTDDTPFITASGKHVKDGIIAANFLPFGTKVKFPALFGDKEFSVEDRMKSNKKVDIWYPDRQSALKFGVKYSEMIIISRP